MEEEKDEEEEDEKEEEEGKEEETGGNEEEVDEKEVMLVIWCFQLLSSRRSGLESFICAAFFVSVGVTQGKPGDVRVSA